MFTYEIINFTVKCFFYREPEKIKKNIRPYRVSSFIGTNVGLPPPAHLYERYGEIK